MNKINKDKDKDLLEQYMKTLGLLCDISGEEYLSKAVDSNCY
jgi:hypothetical protein